MKRNFRYSRRSQKEVRQAACWYESERKGLGGKFSKAVENQVERLAKLPFQWEEIEINIRRSPLLGFGSYYIVYEVHDDHILVLSVFHASREPKDY